MAEKIKIPAGFKDWQYDCKVLRVIDGDTIDVMIDCGFKVFRKERIRLFGINTPEKRTRNKVEKKLGLECTQIATDALKSPKVWVHTLKQGKFGRYLAMIWYINPKGKKTCLNQMLVNIGLARVYYGGSRKNIKWG